MRWLKTIAKTWTRIAMIFLTSACVAATSFCGRFAGNAAKVASIVLFVVSMVLLGITIFVFKWQV
jgi:uncharacterized membrane protein YtjA (UPF0391 family)